MYGILLIMNRLKLSAPLFVVRAEGVLNQKVCKRYLKRPSLLSEDFSSLYKNCFSWVAHELIEVEKPSDFLVRTSTWKKYK